MSDRKLYGKKGTGTIPKIKPRNNSQVDDRFSNVLSNNLGERPDFIGLNRNSGRNIHHPFFTLMESREGNSVQHNGNNTSNSTSSPNTSRTNSRRNSIGTVPKCDNVSKYPDKKQIQTKLNQIQEYIRLTSSLMSNMKNTDEQSNEDVMDKDQIEQMLNDLTDSESKLLLLLAEIENNGNTEFVDNGLDHNETQNKNEGESDEMQRLKEQESLLLHLQLTAENQLRQARLAQEKLSKEQNQIHNANESFLNGTNEGLDSASNFSRNPEIGELEERLKGLNTEWNKNNGPENFQNQIDVLQNKIAQMRDGNDNAKQLIHLLDTQDAQLQAEHSALQNKLMQLQTQKSQIDQLVLQLQNMNEESEDDEMGAQVRSIVNMKEQLAKLQDMLHIVQNTENSLESQNKNESDVEEQIRRLCIKSDNVTQNVRPNRSQDNNAARQIDNNSTHSNERRVKDKQVNKKLMNANERQRIKLQAELQAKKRELEELMCKHKAATSNLNQDVNNESKSDLGISSNNPLYEGTTNSWFPVPNIYNVPRSDRYSSDDCPEDDMNEYSEVNSSGDTHIVQPMPSLNYPTSNYIKRRDDEPPIEIPPESLSFRTASRTPDHGAAGSNTSLQMPAFPRERSRNNVETPNKNQMQKQLELIKSVCDSMLESNQPNNVQLRNNLTPSPVYSEPRYTTPGAHPMNTLNVYSNDAVPFPAANYSLSDPNNYQSWLASNSLQTQTFMLNTLNQCCQMLWLQQRELTSLRNSVNMIQDRCQNFDSNSQCVNSSQCSRPPVPNQPKSNPQAVAGASSLPNLNHTHCMQNSNMDHACANHCNLQNARILDTALNNSHHNVLGEHINNSMCHIQNLPTSQIWNGQALNNQVPPGNRANNYWDNFRSYSRQNLLSTKSNEGVSAELTTNTMDRPQERTLHYGILKLNTDHHESSTSNSVENTPRRSLRMNASRTTSTNPPDVLNINQLNKPNESALGLEIGVSENSMDCPFFAFNDTPQENNFIKDRGNNRRNRNEWHDDTQSENTSPKSKLFEELRENVYREVATLITANQGRPHFLIQLFRDLQLISSDPLRRKTLQSIQSVITNSLTAPGSSTGAMRQVPNPQRVESEENLSSTTEFVDMHLFPDIKERNENEIIETNCLDHLSEVLAFLNSHNEDVLTDNLFHSLIDMLVELTFSTIFPSINNKDGIIQKQFALLLMAVLEKYKGKKIEVVRLNLLRTVEESLHGEFSLIRLMRESITESELNPLDSNSISAPQFDLQVNRMDDVSAPQIQNGDLAEADQSRIELEDDDEGAVGGVLNILLERSSSSNAGQVGGSDENDLPKLDLVLNTESDAEFVEQGLDQVPTRLTTHPTSQSNTPNKGL